MEKLRQSGETPTKVPSHEITYCRLRDMILFGQLTPGQAVTIQGLAATLEAGLTPVREAIRRLTAEGALALQGNRRVMVPVLSRSQIDELAFARLTIEPKIAQMAATHVTPADVAKLTRIDDERLSLVTITNIDVDPEMNRAVVYYDSLAGPDGDEEILEALGQHRVRIQGSVGRQVRAKKTPILSFKPDDVIRAAERIEQILHDHGTLPARPPEPADAEDDTELDGQA